MNICQNLYEPVRAAILATDETGIIKIDSAEGWERDDMTQKLVELETMGFLSRAEGTDFCRSFQLTRQGHMLKESLSKTEKESTDSVSA